MSSWQQPVARVGHARVTTTTEQEEEEEGVSVNGGAYEAERPSELV